MSVWEIFKSQLSRSDAGAAVSTGSITAVLTGWAEQFGAIFSLGLSVLGVVVGIMTIAEKYYATKKILAETKRIEHELEEGDAHGGS